MLHDLELQAKALAPVLKALVSQHIDAAKQEIIGLLTEKHSELAGEFTKRFDAIPTVDVEVIAKSAAALIEIPEPIPGKDADPVNYEDIQQRIDDAAVKAVSALPVPKDGNDADPIPLETVENMVKEAVSAIPVPKDGVSVPVETVQEMVAEQVAKEVAKIPKAKDGDSVPAEAVQAMVEEAVAKAVSAIPKAADGNPGRDALDIEILPVIDAEKSYPRGTYAMHRGGLWKSFQNTVGWTGWECLVNGVHKFHVAQLDANDPRKFYAISELSDCTSIHTDITLPTMQYKQVWKEGVNYQKGDTVTWGGSLWHCEKDTAEKPSEGHECWKLAVKKGRDGKV